MFFRKKFPGICAMKEGSALTHACAEGAVAKSIAIGLNEGDGAYAGAQRPQLKWRMEFRGFKAGDFQYLLEELPGARTSNGNGRRGKGNSGHTNVFRDPPYYDQEMGRINTGIFNPGTRPVEPPPKDAPDTREWRWKFAPPAESGRETFFSFPVEDEAHILAILEKLKEDRKLGAATAQEFIKITHAFGIQPEGHQR